MSSWATSAASGLINNCLFGGLGSDTVIMQAIVAQTRTV